MKTKKVLKFSKETVIILDKVAKKSLNGGNHVEYANSEGKRCTGPMSVCFC